MEDVKCLFCDKDIVNIFWEENGYKGRRCDACKIVYISPRPTEEEMEILSRQGQAGGAPAEEYLQFSYTRKLNSRYVVRIIKKFKKNCDLLEIGPGGGQFLLISKREGFNPFALEINKLLANYIFYDLNIETENRSASDSASFGSRKFDVIYHKDLLYHLHHPKEAFLNFTEKLKDDGVLIFETGNLADVSKIWLKLLGRLDYPEHVYLFSDKSVRELLKISGLELITEYYYSIIPILLIQKALSSFKYGFKISQKTKVKGNLNENFTTLQKIKGFLTHLLTCRLNRFFPHCLPSKIIYVTRKKKKLINRNDEL